MEYDYKHWKAAKALIVVIPLLGKRKTARCFKHFVVNSFLSFFEFKGTISQDGFGF
jgi:hypothetical protein